MDFTFTEEQETIRKLAADVFERRATPERLTEVEAGEFRYDAELWKELAGVDLLGTALPESLGGNGGGFIELGVLLAEVGSAVAPVPAYPTPGTAAPSNSNAFCPASSTAPASCPPACTSPATPTRPDRSPRPVATAGRGGWMASKSWCRSASSPIPC
jgi:hypothetical protein